VLWFLAALVPLILFLGIGGIVMAHPMGGPFSWQIFWRAVGRLSLIVLGTAAVVGAVWAVVHYVVLGRGWTF
jgi:hypothetical protein